MQWHCCAWLAWRPVFGRLLLLHDIHVTVMRPCHPHLQDLRQYILSIHGLSHCGIDPMAAPGTTFAVDFWVWDGAKANATVSRYITITDPCPTNGTATAYAFCRNPADSRCGAFPCMYRRQRCSLTLPTHLPTKQCTQTRN